MSRFVFEAIFTLLALGGIVMLVLGIRLKPDTARLGGDGGEEILLDFPCRSDDASGPLDSEESLSRDEKKAFDPERHQPEKIESRKKP